MCVSVSAWYGVWREVVVSLLPCDTEDYLDFANTKLKACNIGSKTLATIKRQIVSEVLN